MGVLYSKCYECKGNMWPPGQIKDHIHLVDPTVLKKKLRTAKTGWNKPAGPRSNPPRAKHKTLAPRRRAYGPF